MGDMVCVTACTGICTVLVLVHYAHTETRLTDLPNTQSGLRLRSLWLAEHS